MSTIWEYFLFVLLNIHYSCVSCFYVKHVQMFICYIMICCFAWLYFFCFFFFFFQAEDGIRDLYVTGVQTCALPICAAQGLPGRHAARPRRSHDGAAHDAGGRHGARRVVLLGRPHRQPVVTGARSRSEEHTSELQSRRDLVCRLLLEKKKRKPTRNCI